MKWTYYHLYVILDIYSRYAVGWMVATRESAALAEKLIAATCAKQGIGRGQLSIHADRGSSMTSKPVALLLADLGVTQSHSRPHVSNDNPFSEAQFKTLKYRPGFPARFASIEAARAHCQDFFPWYNDEHRHGGLGLHTAADIHYGRAAAVQAGRAQVLELVSDGSRRLHPGHSHGVRRLHGRWTEPGLTVPMAQARRPGRAHCRVFFVRSPHDLHPISTYLPVAQGRGAYGRLWTPPQPHRPGSQDRQERRCDKATEMEVLPGPS